MPRDADYLAEFTGAVRLFPLPNLVMFPHVMQGLHIFEPRYRAMMTDCLADDLMMALVMLKPGWEADYEEKPAIERIACLGRIGVWEKLADGRFNLRLHGLTRIEILRELETNTPYRMAKAEILSEIVPEDLSELKKLRHALADAVLPRFSGEGNAKAQLTGLFESETPLGPLCDMLSYALPLPLEMKQQLLAECDVRTRCEVLTDALVVKTANPHRKFPPDFSIN